MVAHIIVRHKEDHLDPESARVKADASSFPEVADAHKAKYFRLELNGLTPEEAPALVTQLCEILLANLVYERYEFTIE